MGKRKERRLAAMSASGRRVKLDLFAEPSGEMVATDLHDEVGGKLDQNHCGETPSSPSSGNNQENPLLLLGQYSDDELDEEETNKRPKHEVNEGSSIDPDDQVEEAIDAGVENGSSTVEDDTGVNDRPETDKVETIKKPDSNDVKDSDVTPEPAQFSEATDLSTQTSVPDASGTQADADIAGGWKMVLHEESNQYYYWNTLTGETSWVVPRVLAVDAQVTGEPNASVAIDETVGSQVDQNTCIYLNTDSVAYAYAAASVGITGVDPISKHASDYGIVMETAKENGGVAVEHPALEANQAFSYYNTAVAGASYQGSSLFPLEEIKDAHSARLVKYSESLLQRLKAQDMSGNQLEGYQLVKKEIEIRLSDCKALSSYGSSLLPFWWHTETQLNQLESEISRLEASLLIQEKNHNMMEDPQKSSPKCEPILQNNKEGSDEIEMGNDILCTIEKNEPHVSSSNDESKPASEDIKVEKFSTESTIPLWNSEDQQEALLHTSPATVSSHSVFNVEPHVEEDVDMDVEMEVDEETPAIEIVKLDVPSTGWPAPSEQLVYQNPSSSSPNQNSVSVDEPSVPPPPPPDEEWIPPPPPDTEPIPPPPPDEPPETFPSFQDQYNSGYEYYAPSATEGINGNYYAHSEVSHVVEPQPPLYYGPMIASASPELAIDANLCEPLAYYEVASSTIAPVPVVSSMQSSMYYVESGPVSYHGSVSASDQTPFVGFGMDPGSTAVPIVNLVSGISGVTSAAQSVETASVIGSTVGGPLPSSNPKSQSKVVRSKKRTITVAPTLRSNKKVSSLVDKWKAAKEELHGEEEEEEEPENAYEILEKKRLKEIEQWRARQIASGEAQDNANFIPLGGDWRERVKRKKAKSKREARASPHAVDDGENQHPDIVELSKDLPSGWQAFWDDSTKQVYYGNTTTSETSWTRPSS